MSLFCYALFCIYFSVVIILTRKRKLVALPVLSYRRIATINALWLFLMVPWDVIVVLPGHTHLLFLKGTASFKVN